MAKNSSRKMWKSMDVFGEPVSLRLDQKGSKHKTMVGFCVSVLYLLVALIMVVLCVMNDPPLTFSQYPILTQPLEKNSFQNETGVFILVKDTLKNELVPFDEKLEKIIEITFNETETA